MTMILSCKEIEENGKSIVFYKPDCGGAKKCLSTANNFERAIAIERIIKQAISWKIFVFNVDKITESWDTFYYRISLNSEFLITKTNKDDAREYIDSIMKKLNIKKYSIQF